MTALWFGFPSLWLRRRRQVPELCLLFCKQLGDGLPLLLLGLRLQEAAVVLNVELDDRANRRTHIVPRFPMLLTLRENNPFQCQLREPPDSPSLTLIKLLLFRPCENGPTG